MQVVLTLTTIREPGCHDATVINGHCHSLSLEKMGGKVLD